MANGKPGDSPYMDIVVHGLKGYNDEITRLVLEIKTFGDQRVNFILRDLVDQLDPKQCAAGSEWIFVQMLERDLGHLLEICKELKK